jgi:uncharacterized protein YjdB
MNRKIIVFIYLVCASCIGVDFRDDTIRDPELNLLSSETGKLKIIDGSGVTLTKGKSGSLGLLAGAKQLISFEYSDKYGVKNEPTLSWVVVNTSVVSVANNEITALVPGTTLVNISGGDAVGAKVSITVTVVADAAAVAAVSISAPPSTTLDLNQTVQLTAAAKNVDNVTLSNKTFEWLSENSGIVTVSASGLVTAVANGTAEVHAKVDGVKSNSIKFNIGAAAGVRNGTFQSAGGYSTVGSVTVTESGNNLVVQLSSNFQASVAAGTYIYLANSTAGGNVKSAGLDLGLWTPSGTKTFSAAAVPLNQYKYVVVLCRPFGLTFGFAELKP